MSGKEVSLFPVRSDVLVRYADPNRVSDQHGIRDVFCSAHRTLIYPGVSLTLGILARSEPHIVAAPALIFSLPWILACYSFFTFVAVTVAIYGFIYVALLVYSKIEWEAEMKKRTTLMDLAPDKMLSVYGGRQSVFVVLEERSTNKIVGCCAILQGSAQNTYRDPLMDAMDIKDSTIAMVGRVGVAPHLHGKGLGKMLVTCVLQEAQRRGISHLQLTTSSLQPTACHMYERLGFKLIKSQKLMRLFPVNKLLYELKLDQ